MSQPNTEDMDSFLMSEEHLNSKPPKLNTDVLDEVFAEYFTWKGEAIHEVHKTANYQRMKAKIQQLYILKSDVEEAIGEDEEGKQVQVGCPEGKIGCAVYHVGYEVTPEARVRNQQRQEIRTKLGLKGEVNETA